MTQSICPGQDTRFWQPGDVFEVACAECGYEVEFFRDDAMRRCKSCGAKVSNPKMSLGCAQWCEHAEKCLGYDPKKEAGRFGGEAESLTDKAVAAIRTQAPGDAQIMARAMETLEMAQQLLRHEPGDPKTVQLAAVLAGLDRSKAEAIIKELGLDPETAETLPQILAAAQNGGAAQSEEAELVADALALADAKAGRTALSGPQTLKTKAGQELAKIITQ